MFRLLKLKPPNGWNAVGWELAIVTLGVIIALAAQEYVQSLHWKSEVRQTRQALDAELSRDLAAFQYRLGNSACIIARAKELGRWAESLRTDKPLKLKHELIAPSNFAIRTEVWDLIEGDVASRIPLKDRLNYSGLYAGMRGFDTLLTEEGEMWLAIAEYEGAASLSDGELRKLLLGVNGLIGQSERLPAWNTTISRQARELNLVPDANLLKTANPMIKQMRDAACVPYL